jgi:uncharacterized membrane protein YjjB (DUF3815 family)
MGRARVCLAETRRAVLLIFPGRERGWRHGVLYQTLGIDMRVGAFHHLANATLVACFFAAMLVTAHLFTKHRSMKTPSLGIIHGKMLPL